MKMTDDKNAERQAEEAFNSLNAISRATPSPYLLARIYAKLDKPIKNFWENAACFIGRPAVMALGLCLIITINVCVIFVSKTVSNNTVAERTASLINDEDDYAGFFATTDNTDNP